MDTPKKSIIKKVYPAKHPWSYKGKYGRLLIISGSKIFTGAPVNVGMAAQRAGSDVLFFTGPRRAMDVVSKAYPTFINFPLDVDYVDKTCMEDIFDFASGMRINSLVVGPGLWRTEKTLKAILKIIEGFEVPMVIDADAIRAVGFEPDIIRGKDVILTPHDNEFEDLTGVKPTQKVEERAKLVKKYAKELDVTIILKGNSDIISDGKNVAINRTGNPYMTKGGFGDMLAGVCGALLSRRENKVSTYDAACAAAYINGKAGDLAAKEKREGLIVSDAIEKIPEVINLG